MNYDALISCHETEEDEPWLFEINKRWTLHEPGMEIGLFCNVISG
jgi:hypothetical protein